MIGDTMETDILGGVQLGYRTVLVLTGGTKLPDLTHYSFRPDMVVNSSRVMRSQLPGRHQRRLIIALPAGRG